MPTVAWPSTRFGRVLTRREGQVLDLIAIGKSNAETGAVLGIAPATVEVHRQHVMHKLDVTNLAALLWLVLLGTTPPGDYEPSRGIDVPALDAADDEAD